MNSKKCKIQYYTGGKIQDENSYTIRLRIQQQIIRNNRYFGMCIEKWNYSKTRNQCFPGYKYNDRPDTDASDMDLQYQWLYEYIKI